MTTPNYQPQASISEAEFVAIYGKNQVAIPGLPENFTVLDALAMETAFCPADPEKRADKSARMTQLAKYVGPLALQPEHLWLLPEQK